MQLKFLKAHTFLNKMNLNHYSYDLPDELIAQHLANPRDSCKLMTVGNNGKLKHNIFSDIFINLLFISCRETINSDSLQPRGVLSLYFFELLKYNSGTPSGLKALRLISMNFCAFFLSPKCS